MKLNKVVPWGRTLAEYRQMFRLTDDDLTKQILGVGDGPASFNVEMKAVGNSVVSIDPIYTFSAHELTERIRETYDIVIGQLHKNADQYNWTTFRDPDEVGNERMKAMNQFLDDYEAGRQQGRYQATALPKLPFPDQSFDLALCSHFLFLYSEQLSAAFHLESIHELLRVASEVRIFPIIALNGQPSPYLNRVLAACQEKGIQVEVAPIDYHFQKGAHQMLRLAKTIRIKNHPDKETQGIASLQ
ncbi:SAM-dependent methyltransferase [Spirosoma sp. KCTC 42546]|uniref:SAM-dependent methyltransferase n=1 Tax=Spirosoma sp. KCTC 42546 TaxID=2520506 RepID=UPI001159C660|nr:SAM-dependent methyltransferase [Spirosoma sp. KCTC 42546]QDK83534.1 SAM-dependent methyltransferase [Spirosoma sp. KCTC 42546]